MKEGREKKLLQSDSFQKVFKLLEISLGYNNQLYVGLWT